MGFLVASSGCTAAVDVDGLFAFDSTSLELASGAVFPDLLVQIDYVAGADPDDAALDELLSTLRAVTDKRAVRFEGPTEVAPGFPTPETWDGVTRHKLHLETIRKNAATVDEGLLHILYLPGRSDPPASGSELDGVIYVFPNTWREPTNGYQWALYASNFERSVLLHEAGHALGLVDSGVPMVRPHSMAGDRHHSANPESVMYPEHVFDITGATRDLEKKRYFDADDLSDLSAFQARARELAAKNPRDVEWVKANR